MTGWSHAEGDEDHEPDPHYNGNGVPEYWTCHVKNCGRKLLIDGGKVPMTTPVKKAKAKVEPPLSSQP